MPNICKHAYHQDKFVKSTDLVEDPSQQWLINLFDQSGRVRLMWCPKCKEYVNVWDNGEICDKCGEKVVRYSDNPLEV